MPNAKFVLKEPSAKEETLIYLFYNYANQRLKYSTGEKINPKFWNSTKQRVKETSQFPEYPEFNQRLNNIETAINNSYRRLLNNKEIITIEALKKELKKELGEEKLTSKPNDLIKFIEEEIKLMELDKKDASLQVYRALLNHLKNFSELKRYKLTFDTINLDFYDLFKNYLFNKKLLNNTVGKHIKNLKTFLNIATEKGINENLVYKSKHFKAIEEDVEHIYLTDEELELLRNCDLQHKPYLDRVRDLFLIGCHTGLRFSDFTQLKEENLFQKGNRFEFKVITQKTNEKVVIPVKLVVKNILDKYNGIIPRAISNQKMNTYLKELGEIAGIDKKTIIKRTSGKKIIETIHPKYKLISTHTARRSFATNAFLNNVPTISIMKITGHRTEKAFMKYIKVSQERNAEQLSNHPFFQ